MRTFIQKYLSVIFSNIFKYNFTGFEMVEMREKIVLSNKNPKTTNIQGLIVGQFLLVQDNRINFVLSLFV